MKILLTTIALSLSLLASSQASDSWIQVDSERFDFSKTVGRCFIVPTGVLENESYIDMKFSDGERVFSAGFRGKQLQLGTNKISPIAIRNVKFTVLNGGPAVSGADCKIELVLTRKDMTAHFACPRLQNTQIPQGSALEGTMSCATRTH